MLQGELLQEKGILGLEERGERVAAAKVQTNVVVPLVEAPDEVEDERAIGDCLTEVPEVIRHPLETPAVVGDGEITLGEAAKLGVEVEGPSLTVA